MKKIVAFLSVIVTFVQSPCYARADLVIDRIVASVDGEPITLSDVIKVLPGEPPADFEAAREHPRFRAVVDDLITEKLLELEGESRRINVSDAEIDSYVRNVAAHNQLSMEDFRAALVKEGKSLEQFKKSIRVEILRSKLANSLIQEGGGATDADVKAYIEEQYSSQEEGERQLKLRQVLIRSDAHTPSEVLEKCSSVVTRFRDGESFPSLAKELSESPEAKKGGDLGVLQEGDLNSVISDAILNVKAGDISQVTTSPVGCHVFFVEDRFDSSVDSEKLEAEVRAKLNQQKVEEKFQTYFVSEIYKNHTVEKKV